MWVGESDLDYLEIKLYELASLVVLSHKTVGIQAHRKLNKQHF